jgi:hypothetical protein
MKWQLGDKVDMSKVPEREDNTDYKQNITSMQVRFRLNANGLELFVPKVGFVLVLPIELVQVVNIDSRSSKL